MCSASATYRKCAGPRQLRGRVLQRLDPPLAVLDGQIHDDLVARRVGEAADGAGDRIKSAGRRERLQSDSAHSPAAAAAARSRATAADGVHGSRAAAVPPDAGGRDGVAVAGARATAVPTDGYVFQSVTCRPANVHACTQISRLPAMGGAGKVTVRADGPAGAIRLARLQLPAPSQPHSRLTAHSVLNPSRPPMLDCAVYVRVPWPGAHVAWPGCAYT